MRPLSRRNYEIKIVLVGDLSVGKTSMFMRVKDGTFGGRPTVGVEYCIRDLIVDDTPIQIKLWDTAGLERFRTLTGVYYRHCQVVLMVYACDNPSSLDALNRWNADVLQFARGDVDRILVGNKIDLTKKIPDRMVKDFADSKECTNSVEVSAKTGDGIEELLMTAARAFLRKMQNPNLQNAKVLNSASTNDKSPSKNCICR